jgi:hypothetical protein
LVCVPVASFAWSAKCSGKHSAVPEHITERIEIISEAGKTHSLSQTHDLEAYSGDEFARDQLALADQVAVGRTCALGEGLEGLPS